MIKWFKNLKTPEKVMVGLIIMLLIGVVLRWQYIKSEGGESIKNRFVIENRIPK